MTDKLVQDFYQETVRAEWRRLVRDPYHRLEYETTRRAFDQHLPRGGRLLDAGGGPGRYAIDLARRGFQVTLLDLAPANLAFAGRQARRARLGSRLTTEQGSIADLSRFPTGSFDAVLCLGGPLSHLLADRQRRTAIDELIRVARRGAPILVSVMSRLSLLVVELTLFPHEIELPHFRRVMATGDYLGGYGFTACHFFLPEEFAALLPARRVRLLEMIGLEGLAANHRRNLNTVARNPRRWKRWLAAHERTCRHPSVVGLSEHMLAVARKR